jgi:hypothetical protein
VDAERWVCSVFRRLIPVVKRDVENLVTERMTKNDGQQKSHLAVKAMARLASRPFDGMSGCARRSPFSCQGHRDRQIHWQRSPPSSWELSDYSSSIAVHTAARLDSAKQATAIRLGRGFGASHLLHATALPPQRAKPSSR